MQGSRLKFNPISSPGAFGKGELIASSLVKKKIHLILLTCVTIIFKECITLITCFAWFYHIVKHGYS